MIKYKYLNKKDILKRRKKMVVVLVFGLGIIFGIFTSFFEEYSKEKEEYSKEKLEKVQNSKN
jgi:hypothetical protein